MLILLKAGKAEVFITDFLPICENEYTWVQEKKD